MLPSRRRLALLCSGLLLVMLLLSLVHGLHPHQHSTDEPCTICVVVDQCARILQGTVGSPWLLSSILPLLHYSRNMDGRFKGIESATQTLVSWKVKLSN